MNIIRSDRTSRLLKKLYRYSRIYFVRHGLSQSVDRLSIILKLMPLLSVVKIGKSTKNGEKCALLFSK